MARSHGRSAAALAVGVLSALGNAQGYYGGDQSTCDSSDAFVDIGCFSGNNQPLYTPFIVENYDPAALTNSFPGYVGLDNNFNSTVTPLACTTVCRGYGYRTASLRNNVCACGYGVPDPYPPTLSGDCSVPCAGDASQLCGGAVDTRIFLDPSFADPNALATAGAPALAEYYQYLGCFNQESSFPTNDAGNTIIVVDSIEVCLERCAAIRYPLARATKTGNQVTCDCGETFNPDDYRIVEDDELPAGSCNVGCVTGLLDDCDPDVERCCGTNSNFPVYINPELLGCHVPTIPGYGQLDTNGDLTGFICADVPASLISGPQNITTGTYPNVVATITAAPLPYHLLSVSDGTDEFFEYGCYVIMNPGDVLTADLSTPALGPLTLEDCAAACSGYDFFGVEGGDSCYCGNDVDTTADLDAMSSCNVRCEGNDLQLCGGDSALKVYAVSARWNNEVYTSIQSTVISTPYPADSCTVGPTSTASGTSTQTTSSTTTTTGTTTETATASGSSSEPSTVESGTGTGVPSSTGDSSSTETDEPTSTGESSSTATDESSSTDASGSATATDASSGFASATEEPTSTDASSGSASTTEEPTSTGGSATETEEPTSAPSTTGGSETGSETSTVETATGGASTGTGSEEPTGTGTGGAAPTGSNTEEPTGTGSEEPTATGTEEPTSAPLTTGGSETGTDTFESSATSAPFGNSTDATAAPTGTDDLPTTTGFPTGTGASTSTTPSTPTAPPASEQFIFSVAPPVNATLGRRANPHRSLRNAKRQFQVGDGFVGGAGPLNPTDCTLATPFVFNADGTLTSGGEYVSTDPGIAYQPFWTNSVTGAITTTFAVQDGGLVWLNAAFVGGQAGFCQDINGLVWVTFDQNPPPFDCVAVVLIPFATSQCADTGTLVPGGPTTLPGPTVPVPAPTGTGGDTATVAPTVPIPSGTGTDDVTSAPTATGSVTVGPDGPTTTLAPTACSTGACLGNGTLTLGPGTFFADAVAATDRPVAECYVRSESWVFGETTLLPRTTTVV